MSVGVFFLFNFNWLSVFGMVFVYIPSRWQYIKAIRRLRCNATDAFVGVGLLKCFLGLFRCFVERERRRRSSRALKTRLCKVTTYGRNPTDSKVVR